jgi:hypothetical protein
MFPARDTDGRGAAAREAALGLTAAQEEEIRSGEAREAARLEALGLTAEQEEEILEELRERWDYATEEWRPIRAEGRRDMQAIAGDPWDPEKRRKREKKGRPCVTAD